MTQGHFHHFDNYFHVRIKAQKCAIDSVWWPHFDCTGYVCPDEKRPSRRSTPELIAIWEGRYEFRQLISEMVSTPIVKSVHTVMIAERDIHTPRNKFALNNGRMALSFQPAPLHFGRHVGFSIFNEGKFGFTKLFTAPSKVSG